MVENETFHFDFMLVGSSLQAGLIAGLLARVHKKKVCLLSDPSIEFRLAREISLSVDCITRPETWQLLAHLRTESFKLLTGIGGGKSLGRVDPVFVATNSRDAQALAHMFHVARGYGFEIEQEGSGPLMKAKRLLRLRGARNICHQVFRPALRRWLADSNVQIASASSLVLRPIRGGRVTATAPDRTLKADRLILADEEAIRNHAKEQEWARGFIGVTATALVCKPTSTLREKCIINPANRFSACLQDNSGFEIITLSSGNDVATDVIASVPGAENLRPSGRTVFDTCVSADGAPMVGSTGQGSAWVVGGFGNTGAFVSPAIARFLVGKSTDMEEEFFTSRGGGKARAMQSVSEHLHLRSGI